MKICFLSSMHPPLDKRVFEKEALTLAQAGHEVVHVCPGTPGTTEEKGVKLVRYKPPKGIPARLAQFPLLYRLAREEKADVYHCNEVDSWIIGSFLTRKRRVCIFDVHEHYPSTFSEGRVPGFLRPIVARAIRLLYRILEPWTNYFVLAKSSLAPDFDNAKEKVVLVRNFSRVPASAPTLPSRATQNSFDIVHLGAIAKARGSYQMIDALTYFRGENVRLHIVGSFIDGSDYEFWEYVNLRSVGSQIEFDEWMPFEDAFSILQDASVGIIAFQPGIQNHIFASPHKFFDYMAAGLPVIAPNFASEIAEIVSKYEVGLLIDPSDPKAIADAIQFIRQHPSKAKEWGLNGIKAIRSHFNWDTESKVLLSLYSDIEQHVTQAE